MGLRRISSRSKAHSQVWKDGSLIYFWHRINSILGIQQASKMVLLTFRSVSRSPSTIHEGSSKTVYVVLVRWGRFHSQLPDHSHCLAEERSYLVDFHRA
jgi:hypothetical protein